jgi:hypothetical protein
MSIEGLFFGLKKGGKCDIVRGVIVTFLYEWTI